MASRLIHPKMTTVLRRDFFPQTCTIQVNALAQDDLGQPQDSWSDVPGLTGLRCRVGGIGGGERRLDSQTYLDATHQVLIVGHHPSITELHRAVVDGQAYDILLPETTAEQAVTKLIVRLAR